MASCLSSCFQWQTDMTAVIQGRLQYVCCSIDQGVGAVEPQAKNANDVAGMRFCWLIANSTESSFMAVSKPVFAKLAMSN